MKKLGIVFLAAIFAVCIALPASAEEAGGTEATFDQVKAASIKIVDLKIKILQDEKTCTEAAKTKEDIKKCQQATQDKQKQAIEKIKERKK